MNNIIDIKTGNVVQFPVHGKRQQLEIKLTNLQRMLDARYKHLNEILEEMNKIEKSCDNLETKYNKILLDYGKRIGPENVDREYLDFSTAIEFVTDEHGNIVMKLKVEEEPNDVA